MVAARPKGPSVSRQCKLLAVNRSSVYYRPRPVTADDLALMREIDELFQSILKWAAGPCATIGAGRAGR